MVLKNIEAERGRLGLPKYKLANEIGVTQETYNNYVNGNTFIPSDILVSLCNLFDCSADYLLGLTNKRERN